MTIAETNMLPLEELANQANDQKLKVWILTRGAHSVRDIAMHVMYPFLLSGAFANEHALVATGKPVGKLVQHPNGAIELIVDQRMRVV